VLHEAVGPHPTRRAWSIRKQRVAKPAPRCGPVRFDDYQPPEPACRRRWPRWASGSTRSSAPVVGQRHPGVM